MPLSRRIKLALAFLLGGNPYIRQEPPLKPFAYPDRLDPQLIAFMQEATGRLCKWFSRAGDSGPLPQSSLCPEVSPCQEGLSTEALLDDLL